ncbi:restriction endonuclease subunit S [Streptococcus suis]|uniref:restriction endonuclease subunit S n=1 Tax=Streptococcus suis TaxID=1307 RepID=UPI001C977909|nr:restriction endonuclease subunit S [Streptococcus suis]MBY4970658.1 restriction endonuclease subunit S [Streptococcus suis]
MKTNNNIPVYRFQGYTDAWELRKLGEVAEINPKSVLPDEFEYVDLESVVGTEMISHRTEYKNSAPSRAQRVARKGDIFYQTVRPYQKNNYLFDIDSDNFVFSTGYAQLRPSCNGYFMFTVMQTEKFVNNVLDNCTGTSYPAINANELAEISIFLPPTVTPLTVGALPEQEAIGTFFSTLDRHITLHQRKLDTLKEQKKTYLKLLFPAKGQTKPALRFQGFEDDWEEVKLGEVAKMYQPQTITGGDLIEEGIPVFGANGYIGYYSDCNHVTDQVTISARGEGTGTPNFVKAPVWITGNSMVINVDENKDIDKKFLYSNFLAYDFKKYVSGGAQPQLTRDVLSLVKISIPSLPEQEVIGTFFSTLDQKIAQVEDKLASLKEMKKTLLRKLFV